MNTCVSVLHDALTYHNVNRKIQVNETNCIRDHMAQPAGQVMGSVHNLGWFTIT